MPLREGIKINYNDAASFADGTTGFVMSRDDDQSWH
jgi:hypothetical protein